MTYYEEPHHKIHKVTLNLLLKIFYYIFILLQVSNHKAKNIRNSFVHPHQVTSPPTIKYKKKPLKNKQKKRKCFEKVISKFRHMALERSLRVAEDVGFL